MEDKRQGIMQGYKLFFYEMTKRDGLLSLENRTYGLSVLETNFTGLKAYTKYRIEVLGFNNIGDGPVVAVEVYTDEGSKYRRLLFEFIFVNLRFFSAFKTKSVFKLKFCKGNLFNLFNFLLRTKSSLINLLID